MKELTVISGLRKRKEAGLAG